MRNCLVVAVGLLTLFIASLFLFGSKPADKGSLCPQGRRMVAQGMTEDAARRAGCDGAEDRDLEALRRDQQGQ